MTQAADLPYNTPESQGIPSTAIHAFVDAVERKIQHVHSLILLRNGQLVAGGWWEPYSPLAPHMLYSVSKSFTSTAIGMLVAEERLTVDDHVLSFFADEAPASPDAYLRALRVRHLLTMSTGHGMEPPMVQVTDWVRAFFAHPLEYEPGTHFAYNSSATYLLSAIVQRITGRRLLEYLQPRLFEPLGIESPTWDRSPEGIDIGGWGLSITTADIARFGQLYLQHGMWQGAQLLPAEWVSEATAPQITTMHSSGIDWQRGYGYQFWRCRHGAYRADGAFGQFSIVMHAQDAVLAITAGTYDTQRLLDLVWKHLLPAMAHGPLPDDRPAQDALAERLAGLRLPTQGGRRSSALAARLSDKMFTIAPNEDRIEALSFSFGDDGCILTLHTDQGAQRIPCGYGRWLRGRAAIERARYTGAPLAPWACGASGAWADDHTFVIQIWWYETPFGRTLTCRFQGDALQVKQQANVAFESVERPVLQGRLA